MEKFDAVIIGAGQSGMPLAKKISQKGLSVALIEKRAIGGTCINDGCSPTKTMVHSAKVAHLVSRAEDFGIRIENYKISQKGVKNRKNHIVEQFRGGAEKGLKKADNIKIIMGSAQFKSNHILSINTGKDEFEIYGDKILINTGSEPRIPEIKGLINSPFLTSTSIMDLNETPEHLIILGGGYIGLEFAQMFSRFGSKVTIIDKSERLVPKEDKDVSEEICAIFNEEGISTIFNAGVNEVTFRDNSFTLSYKNSEKEEKLKGTHLLIATGRIPSTKNLGLENAGIKTTSSGHVKVNNYFETNISNVYALGDVAGSPPFTHIAYHDAHLAFQHIYEKTSHSKEDRLVPYCIFIDPQLGRIGLNEAEAIEKGIKYKTGKFLMKHAGRALEVDETKGFFKVLVDPETKQIIGATILSMDGGEILAVLQMAMLGNITYDTIATLPIAHPTLAESLNNLMMQIEK
ncbi:dihydrolipoyl dehydrogenase [Echinicola sp. 20G]|uniref:dihydrolipoyl dehydrogenase n=1 Tax=Echinicola sp. 20G TaxID=2781961 RepID=UPI001910DB19|nr:dihydrolipoyl dehydrogenase [Echinicola sp. 20G]